MGQLRLPFKVSMEGCEPLNVRFDPVAMEFRWLPDGRFAWNKLMFDPKERFMKLRQDFVPKQLRKSSLLSEAPMP